MHAGLEGTSWTIRVWLLQLDVQSWRWHTWTVCRCCTWAFKNEWKDSAFLVPSSQRIGKRKTFLFCSGNNYYNEGVLHSLKILIENISSNSLSILLKGAWNYYLHLSLAGITELTTGIHAVFHIIRNCYIYPSISELLLHFFPSELQKNTFFIHGVTMGIQKRHGEVLVFALFYVLFVVLAEVWAITTQLFPVSGKVKDEIQKMVVKMMNFITKTLRAQQPSFTRLQNVDHFFQVFAAERAVYAVICAELNVIECAFCFQCMLCTGSSHQMEEPTGWLIQS